MSGASAPSTDDECLAWSISSSTQLPVGAKMLDVEDSIAVDGRVSCDEYFRVSKGNRLETLLKGVRFSGGARLGSYGLLDSWGFEKGKAAVVEDLAKSSDLEFSPLGSRRECPPEI